MWHTCPLHWLRKHIVSRKEEWTTWKHNEILWILIDFMHDAKGYSIYNPGAFLVERKEDDSVEPRLIFIN